MPRAKQSARLWLYQRPDGSARWVILDGGRKIGTGCSRERVGDAQAALEGYLAEKYDPTRSRDLRAIAVADVMTLYLREQGPVVARPDFLAATAGPIITWWAGKTLADVRGSTCRAYLTWRTSQCVKRHANSSRPVRLISTATARHDLKTLRAAINHWHAERGPLTAVPVVTLPPTTQGRDRWLTRDEVAALVWAAWRSGNHHVARLILIGFYTGTRSGAILALRWLSSTHGGWLDVGGGVLHRRPEREAETKKRKPPVRMPSRLLAHARRWQAADAKRGISHVVHYDGAAVGKLRRSWASTRTLAGLAADVTPHTLRHTCATHKMQAGVEVFEAAGFLGMSAEMLTERYGHHHPDFQTKAAEANAPRTRERLGMKRPAKG